MSTDVLTYCGGCGVAPDDWHRGRCMVVYGRWWATAHLVALLAYWATR
ncbi:hypothetical protein OG559_31035 (plasmid) [Micromonospora sp. NBC_01405]